MIQNLSLSQADESHLGLQRNTNPTSLGLDNNLAEEVIRIAAVTDKRSQECIAAIAGTKEKVAKYIPTPLFAKRIALKAYGIGVDSDGTVLDVLEGIGKDAENAIQSVPLTRFKLGGLEKFFPGPGDLLSQHAHITRMRDVFQKTLDEKKRQQESFSALARSLRGRKFSPKAEGLEQTAGIVRALDTEIQRLNARKSKSQIDAKKKSVESAIVELKNLVLHRNPLYTQEIDQAIIANASGDSSYLADIFEHMRGSHTLSKSEKIVLEQLARTLGQGNFLRVKAFFKTAGKASLIAVGIGGLAATGIGGLALSAWGSYALGAGVVAAGVHSAGKETKILDNRNITAAELQHIYQDMGRTRYEAFHPDASKLTPENQSETYKAYIEEIRKMGVGGQMIIDDKSSTKAAHKKNSTNSYIIDTIDSSKVRLTATDGSNHKMLIDTTRVPPKYLVSIAGTLRSGEIKIQTRHAQGPNKTSPFTPAMVIGPLDTETVAISSSSASGSSNLPLAA